MKRIYTWKEFDKDINTLANLLGDQKYDEIYGIPRGGLIVAVILSHRLGLPLSLEFHPGKKILVVDDICDSGRTISKFMGENITIATLFVNSEHSSVLPDFHIKTTKDWILFPWETIESSKYDYTVN